MENKTAEKVLGSLIGYMPFPVDYPRRSDIIAAMNDYAQQELSAYKVRLKDLIHDMKRTCLDNAEYLCLEKIEETLDTL